MPLKLMYITNDQKTAQIAENNGVDWIFIDLESLGKKARQGHLDTVISQHSLEDVSKVRKTLSRAKLLTRVNPINRESEDEINQVISYGADIVMLPFFKSKAEVESFIGFVHGRVKTCLLLETPEAVEELDSILELPGIDYIHIGLNDLHLGYGMTFMFEPLANGMVDSISNRIWAKGIPFGFGGIARLGEGDLPAELILSEHYRLGSEMVILSRSFCNTDVVKNEDDIKHIFSTYLPMIREYEKLLETQSEANSQVNHIKVMEIIKRIVDKKHNKQSMDKP